MEERAASIFTSTIRIGLELHSKAFANTYDTGQYNFLEDDILQRNVFNRILSVQITFAPDNELVVGYIVICRRIREK